MIFKQVFRIAFITFIWKQYKAWIISSVLLLLILYLIGQAHTDLLQHWEIQQDTSQTGISFVYKWLGYSVSVCLYCLYHLLNRKKSPQEQRKASKNKQKKLRKELNELPENEDPFDEIRHRKKLRSRSDFLLDEQTSKNK